MIDIDQKLLEVEEAIRDENYLLALKEVRIILMQEPFHTKAIQKISYVLRMIGFATLAERYEDLMIYPDDPEKLYNLSVHLIESGDYELSIHYLEKAKELAAVPQAMIYIQCGIAYLKTQDVQAAIMNFKVAEDLDAASIASGWLAYANLLNGKKVLSEVDLTKLRERDKEDLSKIENRLKAANGIHNPRDAHFVQYGKILLRTIASDTGSSVNSDDIGRYVYFPIQLEMVTNTIAILHTLLGTLKPLQGVTKILGIGSEESMALAQVLSEQFKRPLIQKEELLETIKKEKVLMVSTWSQELESMINEIGMSYSLPFGEENKIDDEDLAQNLIAFSLCHNWTKDRAFLPDIIGYMTQTARHDWYDEGDMKYTVEKIKEQYLYIDMEYQQSIWEYYDRKKELLDFKHKSSFDLSSSIKTTYFKV